MATFNEEFRYGSARWANPQEMHRAGLFNDAGVFLGFHRNRQLRLAGDAPLITFGGAGSGKLRDLIAYNVCGFRNHQGLWRAPSRMIVNDPRGELTAIAIANQIRFGKRVYCINPFGLHGLPQHRVNPWNIIRKDSPTFHADVKLLIEDLIPLPHGNDAFFYRRGREFAEAMVKTYVWHKTR